MTSCQDSVRNVLWISCQSFDVMSGTLVRKQKVRAGHRMSTRKFISSVEEILDNFE